jgi:hypothetical protein
MLFAGRRLLRLVVALALLGAGPGLAVADVLVFHGGTAPVVASLQVDDGSTMLPHGDGCHLALPSAPAATSTGVAVAPCGGPERGATLVHASQVVIALRAARPPPSRAPPLLQA